MKGLIIIVCMALCGPLFFQFVEECLPKKPQEMEPIKRIAASLEKHIQENSKSNLKEIID